MSDKQPTEPKNDRTDGGELARPQSAQPNMEEWIARYGGRAHIPWSEWDRAVEEWKAERRAEFERKKRVGRMQSTALQQMLSERNGATTSLLLFRNLPRPSSSAPYSPTAQPSLKAMEADLPCPQGEPVVQASANPDSG